VRAILPELMPWLSDGLVVEPSAGRGDVIAEIRRLAPFGKVLAIDIDPVVLGAVQQRFERVHVLAGDYLKTDLRRRGLVPVLVIGNPPYNQGEAFVRKALKDVSRTGLVVFLMRMGFLASASRMPLFAEHQPDVYVLPQRPSFTGDGKTDGTDYAWLVFHAARRPGASGIVRALPWSEATDIVDTTAAGDLP
jgi:hypothetical protein